MSDLVTFILQCKSRLFCFCFQHARLCTV